MQKSTINETISVSNVRIYSNFKTSIYDLKFSQRWLRDIHIFWDINGRFGVTSSFNLQTSSVCYVLNADILLGSFLHPEDDMFIRG
jgi:hypothetical protein